MYYSKLMLYVLGSVLFSVWYAEWFRIPYPLIVVAVGCIFVVLIRSALIRACCITCVGIALMNALYYHQINEYAFDTSLSGNQVFEGVVISEPREREEDIVVKVRTSNRLRIRLTSATPIFYGDRIRFTCEIRTPEMIDAFDYSKYLIKERIHGACSSRTIEILGHNEGNLVYGQLMRFKGAIRERIKNVLPPAHASLAAGLVIGGTVGIPPPLVEAFQKTGTTHIVAVSGSNFALVIGLVVGLLTLLNVGRTVQFVIATGIIISFALLTGIEASIVRAACMGLLVVAARACGVAVNPRNLVVCAAMLMVAVNPLLLRYDVGFQLSFAATIGLLYGMRLMSFMHLSKRQQLVMGVLGPSLIAYCATLPVLLYNFGTLSLSAPLINMFITPFIPLGMLSVIWSMAAQMLPWFSDVFVFAAWLPLEIILRLVEWGASWSAGYYENLRITLWQMVLWIMGYGCCYYFLQWLVKRNAQL